MKRSEVNALIEGAKTLLETNNFALPPFAYWSPEDWKGKGAECDEIRDCRLGWDITDFGSGDFENTGLVVFTTRNGHKSNESYAGKTYCEKILISDEKQVTPFHFHWIKQEDIINRAGGNLVIKLQNSTPDEQLADTDVQVSMDGVQHTFPAGSEVVLKKGESITLTPFLYHEFWAEPGTGTCISWEVSKVNDDNTDNRFLSAVGRFPELEEDCEPVHLLCTDYVAGDGGY
jgi:D-lyxose ketol-isomerase